LGGDVQLFNQGLPNAFNCYILNFANTIILSVLFFAKGTMFHLHPRFTKGMTPNCPHPISDFYFDEICCFFNNQIGDSFPCVI
jgi:hypothetical protein